MNCDYSEIGNYLCYKGRASCYERIITTREKGFNCQSRDQESSFSFRINEISVIREIVGVEVDVEVEVEEHSVQPTLHMELDFKAKNFTD